MRSMVSGDVPRAVSVNRWFTRCASGISSPRLAGIFGNKLAGSFSASTFRLFVSTGELLPTLGRSRALGLITDFLRPKFFRRWDGPRS